MHQNVEFCGAFRANSDGLAFVHAGGGIDHSNCSVHVLLQQKLRFSARGVGNERRLVLHAATRVAKAQFRRAECVKSLGVRR